VRTPGRRRTASRGRSGSIAIAGIDLARGRSRALERTNFAAVYAPLPGNLTVLQNLRVFGMMYGVADLPRRIDEELERFALGRFRHTRCGVLSSGEQTRVSLAKAMLNRLELLLLDEPTASLDPAIARELRAMIRTIVAAHGTGVLWTSHNMYEVEEVCPGVSFVPLLLGAVPLWDFFTRVMQGVTTTFFEDVWARNLLNVFATPLTIAEHLAVGVFYPLATLPAWLRGVAYLLPPSYVFENARAIVAGRPPSGAQLALALALAVAFVVLAGWIFARTYRAAVRTGLIARYSAETVS
jgi:ABC-type Na+ transport system ATPase subunit NatA